MKKTVLLGASLKAHRYSNKAIRLLTDYGHEVIAIGLKEGEVNGVKIYNKTQKLTGVHTVTLYLSPKRQSEFYDYILSLNPKRIIMNPGTENEELKEMAIKKQIEVVEFCTLVMLNMDKF